MTRSSKHWPAPVRAGTTPLGHLIGGETRSDGPVFERADPCDPSRIVSRAHAADAGRRGRRRARRPRRAARVGGDCRSPSAPPRCAAIAALIGERRVELAGVVAAETGKIRLEAVPEVQEGVDLIETYCSDLERHDGYRIPLGRLSEAEDNSR